MNNIKKFTLGLCVAVICTLLFGTVAFAEYYEFTIEGPDDCAVGETIDVTVTLSSDEVLADSDVFFVYDTDYFEYADEDYEEYDSYAGTVRLRGDFSEDSYSCSWTISLTATDEGTAQFTLSDKWVKNSYGTVVTSTANDMTIEIEGESSGTIENTTTDGQLADQIYFEQEFEFNIAEPKEVPSCFDETTGEVFGLECKVWNLNSGMAQKVDYSADLSEFYAIYGSIGNGEECWYLYDTENETVSRLLMLQDVEIEKEPEVSENDTSSDNIFSSITKLIVIVFIVLVILIIVVNVIFSRLEKKSRKKKIQERQRLSREELMQKRELERKIQEKRSQEDMSSSMQGPGRR